VLKQPDAAFSQGVVKVENQSQLAERAAEFLGKSELVVAQEFLPTTFDWRVGMLDRQPLFVCKYHMAPRHWQIVKREGNGRKRYGKCEAIPLEHAPQRVLKAAARAANLVGDGLYGVDVKEVRGRPYVIEVNDNPNIDAGVEDRVLGSELYRRVMQVFWDRLERWGNE
jgi:glutathione synthase/RimK-type ligase-like ATP-grasp enzyme